MKLTKTQRDFLASLDEQPAFIRDADWCWLCDLWIHDLIVVTSGSAYITDAGRKALEEANDG